MKRYCITWVGVFCIGMFSVVLVLYMRLNKDTRTGVNVGLGLMSLTLAIAMETLPVAPQWVSLPWRSLAGFCVPQCYCMAAWLFQATTLFQLWLITVLMKCNGSENVTGWHRLINAGWQEGSGYHTQTSGRNHSLAAFQRHRVSTVFFFCLEFISMTLLFYDSSISFMIRFLGKCQPA